MNRFFQVVVADMPWAPNDSLNHNDTPRGAEANYPVLDIEALKKLPIKDLADPSGCVMAHWVLSSMLQDGLDVMKEYAFVQKQSFIWVKTKIEPLENLIDFFKKAWKDKENLSKESLAKAISDFSLKDTLGFYMGRFFRNCHEICLIGINNTSIYKQLQNKSQRTVCFATNLKHSAKPENLQDSLDLMLPNARKIELFARRQRKGYWSIGNESFMTLGEDINFSLKRLSELTDEEFSKIDELVNNYTFSNNEELQKIWKGII